MNRIEIRTNEHTPRNRLKCDLIHNYIQNTQIQFSFTSLHRLIQSSIRELHVPCTPSKLLHEIPF